MNILVQLLLAHFIGDFVLQPGAWVREKERRKIRSWKLYLHLLIHGVLIILLCGNIQYWPLALLVMLAHGVIDVIKLYAQKDGNRSGWFIADQLLHLASITILWFLYFDIPLDLPALYRSSGMWIYITALVFITLVWAIVMRELMQPWTKALNDGNNDSLNNAGKYIGILERLFVFLFIVTGHWEGVGFLLAAKSVFRFGDLKESKDRKLTEYILIGTLLSFGIAIGTGMLVQYLMRPEA
jgi:hypothetical protein